MIKRICTYLLATLLMTGISMPLSAGAMENAGAVNTEMDIAYNDGKLIVKNGEDNAKILILTMLGVPVYEGKAKGSDYEVTLNLKKGIYILKIGDVAKRLILR
ncbi:MAG: T9SS type A sorting domain-containing protein [Paludibacteraceae bacterium]|nr:T9SS type A sorting domain-containing protein [Candidatus Physcocola equi]MCQ2234040.1 T9SS type A sorting domain-containing protein [Paludibacteraceae bacterium]